MSRKDYELLARLFAKGLIEGTCSMEFVETTAEALKRANPRFSRKYWIGTIEEFVRTPEEVTGR
jgi:hypothetical protein